jgi:hypothetical protein
MGVRGRLAGRRVLTGDNGEDQIVPVAAFVIGLHLGGDNGEGEIVSIAAFVASLQFGVVAAEDGVIGEVGEGASERFLAVLDLSRRPRASRGRHSTHCRAYPI